MTSGTQSHPQSPSQPQNAGNGHAGTDDAVLPFAVEALDVRGRVVRLGPAVDTILRRHGYPDPVARLLGEAAALTVLLGSSLKFEGRFQLQTKTDGPVAMIVVDFEAPDRLRATARFEPERVAALGTGPLKDAELIGTGHLAMTIDQGTAASRYQGVVALEGQSLEEAAHQYFRQSEQIPTEIKLEVAKLVRPGCRFSSGCSRVVDALRSRTRRLRSLLSGQPSNCIATSGSRLGPAMCEQEASLGPTQETASVLLVRHVCVLLIM